MTILKKILSISLCILMLASALPFSALNAGAATVTDVAFDDIVKAAADVIRPNEGYYSSVNPNDNGAVSIGWIQWHANRALNLLRDIVARDNAKAKELLGDALYNEITNSATVWTTRIMTKDESAKLSALLDTQNGHDAQDALAAGDIASYINHAIGLGVKDPSALVYHADIENQCGWGGAKKVLDAASVIAGGYDKITLDILYEAALADGVAGRYAVRRQKTYNNCLFLQWEEIDTDLEVWDILSARNVRQSPDTQSALITSISAGMKVVISEKVYYPAENSTRAKTTMGWITLDAKATVLNTELSGGTVPAPINFDTNGGDPFAEPVTVNATGRNVLRGSNDLIIYDSEYSKTKAPTNAYGTEMVVDSAGTVTVAPAYGICKSEIPEGGFVLSGHSTMGSWLSSNIKAGYYVSFDKSSLAITVYKDKGSYLSDICASEIGKELGELPVPKRSGYAFCGWQDLQGNDVSFDTVCDSAMCITLKAVWEQSEGTKISYNKNGGSFENTVDAKVDGINVPRAQNTLIIYRGSATTSTNEYGTEVAVDANGRITAIGSYGKGNTEIPKGGFVISSHGEASKWLASFIEVGSIVEFDEDAMTLTVYKDTETYDSINKSIMAGEAIGKLPEISKEYHTFLGWYTASGEKVSEKTLMPEGGVLLIAKWETLPGNIVYNTNGGILPSLKSEATISGTNIIRGADSLVIFNDRTSTRTNAYGAEVLVGGDGIIDFVHPSGVGNTVIPAGSYVLSGHGTMAKWLTANAKTGNYVVIDGDKISIWESKEAYTASKNTTVLYGNNVGDLLTPKKDGHVFLGWQDGSGNTVTPQTTVSTYGDLQLTANWEKLLTVTFNPSGGAIASTKAALPANAVNTMREADKLVIYVGKDSTRTNGYGAEAIVNSEGIVIAIKGYGEGNNSVPDGGMVLSAHGKAKELMLECISVGSYVTVSDYTVNVYESPAAFDAEDGRILLKKGSVLGALANAVMPNKALSGWTLNGVSYNKDSVINEDITLLATWTAFSADLVFNTDGGAFTPPVANKKADGFNIKRPSGSLVVYDDSYPGGKTLNNAYGTEVIVNADGTVSADPLYGTCKTVIPEGGLVISGIGAGYHWILDNIKGGYYVSFDKDTNTIKVYKTYSDLLADTKKTIHTGKPYGPLPTPEKNGYVFCGWKDAGGRIVTEASTVTSCDTPILTAVWEKRYTVTLDLNGGTFASATANATGINVPRGSNDLIIYRNKATTGANMYGAEAAIDISGKVVAVYPYGNKNAPIPAGGFVLSGHGTMSSWITTSLKVGKYVQLSGTTIKVFDTKEDMKIESEGKLTLSDNISQINLPTPKRTGYDFLGWYNGSYAFTQGTPITQDISLTAKWEKKTVSVKYDLDGGIFANTAKITANGRNVQRTSNSIIIYDDDHESSSTGTNINGTEIVVASNGTVTEVRLYGQKNAAIPEGGFVLSGHGTGSAWLKENVSVGNRIVLSGNDISVYRDNAHYEMICNKRVLFGDAMGSLPAAAKSGATFAGWMLPDGTVASESTIMSYDTSEIVLLAKWN